MFCRNHIRQRHEINIGHNNIENSLSIISQLVLFVYYLCLQKENTLLFICLLFKIYLLYNIYIYIIDMYFK